MHYSGENAGIHVEIVAVAYCIVEIGRLKKERRKKGRRKRGIQPTLDCRSWSFGITIYAIVSFPFGRWRPSLVYKVEAWCEFWSTRLPYVCIGSHFFLHYPVLLCSSWSLDKYNQSVIWLTMWFCNISLLWVGHLTASSSSASSTGMVHIGSGVLLHLVIALGYTDTCHSWFQACSHYIQPCRNRTQGLLL